MSEAFSTISANPSLGTVGDIHVFVPEGATSPVPFVLAVHGGAWRNGDQRSLHALWPKLAPLGIGLVTMSYRKTPEFLFPALWDDGKQVLRWLKENGAAHGLDVSRCVLMGSSAGGHLAMLLAARATAERLPGPEIQGVAVFCGIMDLVAQRHFDRPRGVTMVHHLLGSEPEEDPALYRSASPLAHLHPGMPPVWLAHGNADKVVSVAQSRLLRDRLHALGGTVTLLEACGVGHSWREMDAEGKTDTEILFEKDFLRFLHHRLLTSSPAAS